MEEHSNGARAYYAGHGGGKNRLREAYIHVRCYCSMQERLWWGGDVVSQRQKHPAARKIQNQFARAQELMGNVYGLREIVFDVSVKMHWMPVPKSPEVCPVDLEWCSDQHYCPNNDAILSVKV